MTTEEMAQGLKAIAPTAHVEFEEHQDAPFIAYLEKPSERVSDDFRVLKEFPVLEIEIYCEKTDYVTVPAVKDFFTENEIIYEETAKNWLKELGVLMTVLEVTLR